MSGFIAGHMAYNQSGLVLKTRTSLDAPVVFLLLLLIGKIVCCTLQNVEIYTLWTTSSFAESVTDGAYLHLRATTIPANTKATTDWGITFLNRWD